MRLAPLPKVQKAELVKTIDVSGIIVDNNIVNDFNWMWNNMSFFDKLYIILTGKLRVKNGTQIT